MGKILVIMTGGTIDSEPYSETPAKTKALPESLIPSVLKKLDAKNCDTKQWAMKDSKDFSEAELIQIVDFIKSQPYDNFIITHGTDATVQNARFFLTQLKGQGKTVVFTGAMEPLTHGNASDGEANLDLALKQMKYLTPGVFIIGREEISRGKFAPGLFTPDEASKDHAARVFRRKDPDFQR